MATNKAYVEYIMEKLKAIGDFSYRPMMGEYVVYYKGKVIGGLYDNNFLLKTTKAAETFLENISLEVPYSGAKPMIMIDIEENKNLKDLFEAMYLELPEPKKKK